MIQSRSDESAGRALDRETFDRYVECTQARLRARIRVQFGRRRGQTVGLDDLVQETYAKAWEKSDQLDGDADADGFLQWCLAFARRVVANARRSETRKRRLLQRIREEGGSLPFAAFRRRNLHAAEEFLAEREEEQLVMELFRAHADKLPTLHAIYLEDKSVCSVAREHDVHRSTIHRLIHQERALLTQFLDGNTQGECAGGLAAGGETVSVDS